MSPDALVRRALWTSVPANLGVACLMLAPTSAPGGLLGLPGPAPEPIYRVLLALFLALFGGVYAWLARRPVVDRPLVAFAAIGKSAAFLVTLALWLGGGVSGRWTLVMSGDLVLAGAFAWWLLATRS